MKSFLFLVLWPVLLLSGCAFPGGELTNVWRQPNYFGGPKQSVAVVVLAYRDDSRREAERVFADALRLHGVTARTTYGYLPVQEIFDDEPSAVAKIRGMGVQAVLSVRLADPATLRNFQISPGNPGTGLEPWQNWYDFFDVQSAFATGPDRIRTGAEIGIQATFYSVPDGNLLWSGTALPTVRGDGRQLAELASQIVTALQESALIP